MTILYMMTLGTHLRTLRTARELTLREVADRVKVEPSYLSKVECGKVPASENLLRNLAKALDEDEDVLMLLSGRVPDGLVKAIKKRPHLFAEVLRQIKTLPDDAILRIVREVRDGKW
jgi:transcriptional regulator with XRE-family HTH domain